MYQNKDLSYGFVILSPEANYGRILTTVRSIRANYGGVPVVCSVVKETTAKELEEIGKICDVYRGKSHFTSLINTGIKNGHKGWNVLVTEGAVVPKGVLMKYGRFVEDEKDILFAIMPDYNPQGKPVRLNNTFYDCSLNGILVHQRTFKDVGNMTDNPMEISRVLWATDAIRKGYRFKAVLGIKIC